MRFFIRFLILTLILITFSCGSDNNNKPNEENKPETLNFKLEAEQVKNDSIMKEYSSELTELSESQEFSSAKKEVKEAQECNSDASFRTIKPVNTTEGLSWKITYCNYKVRGDLLLLTGDVYARKESLASKKLLFWTSDSGLIYKTTQEFYDIYKKAIEDSFSSFDTSGCDKLSGEEKVKCEKVKALLEDIENETETEFNGVIKISENNKALVERSSEKKADNLASLSGKFDIEICSAKENQELCYHSVYNIPKGNDLVWVLPLKSHCNCPKSGKIIVKSDNFTNNKNIIFKETCGDVEVTFDNYEEDCEDFVNKFINLNSPQKKIGENTCTSNSDCSNNALPYCSVPDGSPRGVCVACIEDNNCESNQECKNARCVDKETTNQCTEDNVTSCGDKACYTCIQNRCAPISQCNTDNDCCTAFPNCLNGVCVKSSGDLNAGNQECINEYVNIKTIENAFNSFCSMTRQ